MKGIDHPFFRHAWRRWLALVAIFGWAALEYLFMSPAWALFFLGLGTFTAWQFYIIDWSKYDGDPSQWP